MYAGKHTQFPLENESLRARSPGDDLNREQPLLLNPCVDEPENYFRLDPFLGQLIPMDENIRAAATIRILGLNRKRLCERRKLEIQDVVHCLKALSDERISPELRVSQQEKLRKKIEASNQFTLACRLVHNQPTALSL
jgi:hypothetical protein